MSTSLSIGDLATPLLMDRVKTFEELASSLGIDVKGAAKLKRFKNECKLVLPEIEDKLRANEPGYGGAQRQFSRQNLFPSDMSLAHHIWEITKSGNWIAFGAIKLYVQPRTGRNDFEIQDAIEIVANPWHHKNQGRSILFKALDNIGFPLYGMAFSIPEPIMEVCEAAWGKLPRSHPPIVQDTQGGSATITLPKDQPA